MKRFQKAYCLLSVVAGCAVIYGIVITPRMLQVDFSAKIAVEQQKTSQLKLHQSSQLLAIESALHSQLDAVDPVALRKAADKTYKSYFAARQSYDQRFALSQREKAQLRMSAISTDSARSYRDAVVGIAKEASPPNSDVEVREKLSGMELRINFDMSSLTSGEIGSRTKHNSVDSLRKEVNTLISRVANDVFQFCRTFELQSINVGCRHQVTSLDEFGKKSEQNMVLYRVIIDKDRVPTLDHNPFLDVYSTTEFIQVAEDNFKNIEITMVRL